MTTWQTLGFEKSPYNFSPLSVLESDVNLLVGRAEESIDLYTILDSRTEGVCVISGQPGVGKTSFLNVNQFLLETGKAKFGPQLLSARRLCSIRPEDSPRDVAARALHSLHRSVQEYCAREGLKMPPQTQKVGDWINGVRGGGGGYDIGLQILGFGGNIGREINVPSVAEVTFEGLQDVISCVAEEVASVLLKAGAIIALDNIENLDDTQLGALLIGFRDTLFTVPGVWWIVIGQSGLGSLIQALDPRVSERVSGKGLELSPISLEELNQAIEKRVSRFHSKGSGKAPLPAAVHEHLYKASHGEIRFVFKYSEMICLQYIRDFRIDFVKANPNVDGVMLDEAIGNALVQSQISEEDAIRTLQQIVSDELKGLNLKPKEKEILQRIGEKGSARAKDFEEFGLKSMQDFSSNYLSKLHSQHLLVRQQEGRAVLYRLRGIASMALEFGLLKPTEEEAESVEQEPDEN